MSSTLAPAAARVYTKSESPRPPFPKGELPPMFDDKVTAQNWHKKVNWIHTTLLVGTPLIGLYGALTTTLQTKTLIWSIIYYYITGLGITAGYHRYWAHRSYRASTLFRWILCLAGSGAVEGSIQWWSRGHRAHHRWTDTDKDPYSAHRGLFFSHLGWMLVNRPRTRIGYADTADLKADPIVKIQQKHYPWFALIMGFIFPTLVAGLGWGDYRGGYFYAGVLRLVFVHHATFCVNSLAHFLGDHTFDDEHTPRDHFITALVTMGEGYHNMHHSFPQDYRNAILIHQYDPTKWLIWLCSLVGLTYDLKVFPANEMAKGRIYMEEKKIEAQKKKLKWGIPLEQLPVFSWDEFQEAVNEKDCKWILLEGILYDVENFMEDHPGGLSYIKGFVGKDATGAFNGGVYNHSNGARNLLSTMRCGVVEGGMEVESMKKHI
ncbi:unnamed protein product [Umbelopsis ramanniana]